ncbi:MAG: hypothetical protein M0P71_12015 [Melioribacteraceae bacterium]|jgi:hypothetical protein|nr:hypothetical protein [Melioribacteraceae bacterium]
MRLLRINGNDIDIDDNTSIGITLQAYDIKEPGKRKITVSNSFTIPATAHNLAELGFPGNAQVSENTMYESKTLDYWVNNEQIIKNAKVRLEQVSDNRINLFCFQKPDLWDEMKTLKTNEFVEEIIAWMQTEKGLPSEDIPFVGNLSDLCNEYSVNTEGLILTLYFGNLFNYTLDSGVTFLEVADSSPIIYLDYWKFLDHSLGGHWSIFAKTIFEFIEYKYSVKFYTEGGGFIGNIWDDPIALQMYTPFRNIMLFPKTVSLPTIGDYWFTTADYATILDTDNFKPLNDIKDKDDKTLYDYVNAFFQHFNIIKDEFQVNGIDVIALRRWDDMKESAPIKNWSDKLSDKDRTFKPSVDGFSQNSYIKFKERFEGCDEERYARIITSLNEGLDKKSDLFSIDAYVPAFIKLGNATEFISDIVPDLSSDESFKTFQFFINDGLTTNDVIVNFFYEDVFSVSVTETAELKLYKPALYNLNSEYVILTEAMQHPKYWEVECWLTMNDILNIEFWRKYYFRELNGCFFLNKISGFNPEKSKAPTKLELFKISDQVPEATDFLDFWVDGINDPFTDGDGDYFY